MSVYGWPATEVGTAFERSLRVARELESSVGLAPPLVGLWLFNIGRGQLMQADEISHELFKIARDSPASAPYRMTHWMGANACLPATGLSALAPAQPPGAQRLCALAIRV